MERIKQIWQQLESGNSTVAGLLKLRYSETGKCDVFLGVKIPEMYRMLIVRVPFQIGKEFKLKYEFRGLKFEKIYDPDDSHFLLLNLVLIDKQFKDVFDSLVSDVLEAIIDESNIKVILKSYSNRLVKWQSLFERLKQPGLTPEEQRGLFGELYFIRKFIQFNQDSRNVIISWVGPEKQIKDFQSGTWSVEVKTTHGNNHQKVHISSERQLDTTNLEFLCLNHISLNFVRCQVKHLIKLLIQFVRILKQTLVPLINLKAS
ncbi:MAG: PD-(D/E)XK motif protein [Bacteroidetes bacterium]|nr:PD-(D/E)XK motif protein [Bacteroidota bacterium]